MDIEYLLVLQNLRESMPGFVASLANVITALGIALPIVIGVLAYWVFDKRFGFFVLMSFSLGTYIVQSTKLFFCVYRPWILDGRVVPYAGAVSGATGYSFPSGHSAMSSSGCFSVAWWWRKRRVLCVCFVLLALLCGFTRNFLGVHTPQDVCAGLCIGVLSVALAWLLQAWLAKGGCRDIIFFAVCTVLAAVSMVIFSVKSYPLDYVNGQLLVDPASMMKDAFKGAGWLFGFAAGYLLEHRAVKVEPRGWSKRAVVCAIVGIVLLGVLYLVSNALCTAIMPDTAAIFVKITLVGFFGVGVWPAAMKRFAWPDDPALEKPADDASVNPAGQRPDRNENAM